MGSSALPLMILLMSFIHAGLTQDSPRSSVSVTPDSPVFTGETVTLKCEIETYSDWRYEWYKDTDSVMLQTSDHYTVNGDTLTIRGVITSDQGQYSCGGQRDESSNSSVSSSVFLTVKDSPRSTLTVTPDSPVFTGETVNLTCVTETYSDWRYVWYKNSVKLKTSDHYTVNRDTLTIRGVITSDQDWYSCRGQRDERPNSSVSNSVSLSVKDSPRSRLTVTPDNIVFTGETVNLKCVIEIYSDWRYEWYKSSVILKVSDHYTVNRDTLTIKGASRSDQGYYSCRGRRDEGTVSLLSRSASLYVDGLPISTLTVTPDSPVFIGETVNLTCVIESYSNWRYEWYKDTDSVMLQTSDRYTVNRDTLTIRGVITSDQGQYWCRGQRDQKPNSSQSSSAVYVTVKGSGQISVFKILSFLLAACPYLLSTVVLLFKCYRARESQDAGVSD